MPTDPARPIALIGLMGAGKTTVARALGERLGVSVADLDAMLVAEAGRSIPALFEEQGEPRFRRRERLMLERALAAGVRVLACGGGIVTDAGSRALLAERCTVVWLVVSPAVAAERIRDEVAHRPLAAGADLAVRLAALERERAGWYAGLATRRVDTDQRTGTQVVDAVLAALSDA
jgi:shikimate kinase